MHHELFVYLDGFNELFAKQFFRDPSFPLNAAWDISHCQFST